MKPSDDAPIDPAELEAELRRPLPAELREIAVEVPPQDFAARVMAARASVEPARRGGRLAVAGVLLVAAAAVLFYVRGGDGAGEAHPTARESIALGKRGTAVAEAGAALEWRVSGGRAEITQTAGSVFYRVERGGPFVVHTPAGDVEVRGTCFNVEVMDMKIGKQGFIGAGVGAALAATVMVAVYEGHVVYANEHGHVSLAAGERATGSRTSSPVGVGAAAATAKADAEALAGLTREQLAARAETQQREIAALQAQVRSLGGTNPAGTDAAGRRDSEHDKSYMSPTKEDLLEMAKQCRLKWDSPQLSANATAITAERATEMGLSDDERQAMNRATTEFGAKMTADLRAIYIDLTGDTQGADTLSASSMQEEIEEKSPRADIVAAYQRLAREKAGLQAAADPKTLLPIDRMMRVLTTAGDRYERDLGAAIGPDLAHKLREQNNGWGSKHGSSYGCPEGQ